MTVFMRIYTVWTDNPHAVGRDSWMHFSSTNFLMNIKQSTSFKMSHIICDISYVTYVFQIRIHRKKFLDTNNF